MIYTIRIDSDQPFADQAVVNGAQIIAEQLEEADAVYTVKVADQFENPLCSWPVKPV